MTLFQVFDKNHSAGCWSNCTFNSMTDAMAYARSWTFNPETIPPNWDGSPIDYSGYGDIIEVRVSDKMNTNNQSIGDKHIMNTKEAWVRFHNLGVIATDELVIALIQEVVNTVHSLENIYGTEKSALFVRALLVEYQALTSIARSRELENIPSL